MVLLNCKSLRSPAAQSRFKSPQYQQPAKVFSTLQETTGEEGSFVNIKFSQPFDQKYMNEEIEDISQVLQANVDDSEKESPDQYFDQLGVNTSRRASIMDKSERSEQTPLYVQHSKYEEKEHEQPQQPSAQGFYLGLDKNGKAMFQVQRVSQGCQAKAPTTPRVSHEMHWLSPFQLQQYHKKQKTLSLTEN